MLFGNILFRGRGHTLRVFANLRVKPHGTKDSTVNFQTSVVEVGYNVGEVIVRVMSPWISLASYHAWNRNQ